MNDLKTGLLLDFPDITHWTFFNTPTPIVNPSGDWTRFKLQDEAQSRPNFDTQGCADFATLKAWMMLAKAKGYTDFPQDASERYTGALSGTGPHGTDPHIVAETTRKTAGILPQASMPWTDQATFETYYDRQQAEWNLPFGSSLLSRYRLTHAWVFPFGTSLSPVEKQVLIKQALTRGTVCVSLSGNYRYDPANRLVKEPREPDTHWAVLLRPGIIHDQYAPFEKELAPDYDHQAAKVYFLEPLTNRPAGFFARVWENFSRLWQKAS